MSFSILNSFKRANIKNFLFLTSALFVASFALLGLANNQAFACHPEPDKCEMTLTKIDDPDPVKPGDTLTYYLTLENVGTANCTGGGVLLKDYWDEMTNYNNSSQSPQSLTDDFAVWNFGTLEPGEIEQVELTMTVSEQTICGSTLTNKAKFWSKQTGWSDWVYEYTDVECEPVCGNEILEEGEQCDDGNTIDGDGCSAICEIEQEPEPVCGNEILEQGEECDDGNTEDGDGCSAMCLIEEPGPEPVCGNEVIEEGEECDDGNTESGDGCSDVCLIEESEPDQCTIDGDGDGYYAEGEGCEPLDCNDEDAEINPGAEEICDDEIDNNCDGLIDSEDSQCADQGDDGNGGGDDNGDNGNGGGGNGGTTPPGGGGGGVGLTIFNEQNEDVSTSTSDVSWSTNLTATSRVVYGTVSIPVVTIWGEDYGYASSSAEYDTNATSHAVIVTDLEPGTIYYWRAVSSTSSIEVWGDELSFTTLNVTSSEPVQEQESVEDGTGGGGGGTGGAGSEPTPEPEPDLLEEIQDQIEEIQDQIQEIQQEIAALLPPISQPETPESQEVFVEAPVITEEPEQEVAIEQEPEQQAIVSEPTESEPEQPKEKGFIEFLLARVGDLFINFLASVNDAVSGFIGNRELPCMPNWLVVFLIIFSIAEGLRAWKKKIKEHKYLFFWALLLTLGMILFYGSIYACINIFIVIILGLMTLLVRWFVLQDKQEAKKELVPVPDQDKRPSYLDWEKTSL